jgi:8-oxo-dGTP diphosphatase
MLSPWSNPAEAAAHRADWDGHARPSLAVDVAVLTVRAGALAAVLVQRPRAPYRGGWALPGAFVGVQEPLAAAVSRALGKAGLEGRVYVEQLFTFDARDRDPRGRVVRVAHTAFVPPTAVDGLAAGAALCPIQVAWPGERGGPVDALGAAGALPLAFDHADILGLAVRRLRAKIGWTDVGFALLPAAFPLRDLQTVHEAVLGRPLNTDSFRRRMLATGLLAPTGEREEETTHRPAALYRFVPGGQDG